LFFCYFTNSTPIFIRMLNYTKTLLRKVSFDPSLFKKELQKASDVLSLEDYEALMTWVTSVLIPEVDNPNLTDCVENSISN
jgi:hypothetical protein